MVEICRAIQQGSSLLIFDEPTSALSDAESQEVFRIVRALRERNMGVIYITHRLEELRAIGDRVTVLRDGETVHSGPLGETSANEIIRHMVGRELTAIYTRSALPPGDELLAVRNLARKPALDGITFSLRAGEIVGMAGLIGAGPHRAVPCAVRHRCHRPRRNPDWRARRSHRLAARRRARPVSR